MRSLQVVAGLPLGRWALRRGQFGDRGFMYICIGELILMI